MEITLKLPDFKFKVGDIVELFNTNNDKSAFVKVTQVNVDGIWSYANGETHVVPTESTYVGVYQKGSFCDDEQATPLRPGQWAVKSKERMESFSALAENFAFEHIEGDNEENLDKRLEEWELGEIEI